MPKEGGLDPDDVLERVLQRARAGAAQLLTPVKTATLPATSISLSGVLAAETTICADAEGVGTG